MRSGAKATARLRVSAITPALLTPYGAHQGVAIFPAMDAMLTMRPPPAPARRGDAAAGPRHDRDLALEVSRHLSTPPWCNERSRSFPVSWSRRGGPGSAQAGPRAGRDRPRCRIGMQDRGHDLEPVHDPGTGAAEVAAGVGRVDAPRPDRGE